MNREQSARHEAAHVVAAKALGWVVRRTYVLPDGGGRTIVYSPPDLDPWTHAREFAVISFAAQAHIPLCGRPDRNDRRDVYRAFAALTDDPVRLAALQEEARRHARGLVEMGEFRGSGQAGRAGARRVG